MLDTKSTIINAHDYLNDNFKDDWNTFSDNERTYLLTSISCFEFIKKAEQENGMEMDYSSSICPLMKTLEFELEHLISNYLDYLKENVSIDDYIIKNNRSLGTDDVNHIAKDRNKIFIQINGNLEYMDRVKKFSLGSFKHSCCMLNEKNFSRIFDATFLDYCQSELFDEPVSKKCIVNWLGKLIDDIEEMRDIRNRCSHNGKIIHFSSAKQAINSLIDNNVIMKIAFPCDFI